MGYIAPVPQYQYQQYQERVKTKPKVQDPFPITENWKADLNPKFRNALEENIKAAFYKENPNKRKEVIPIYENFEAGKGRHLNEYV
ncbi:hypothetical protein [Lederbergia citrea]|uniref:Uncharacterized protein n=1 Tax=Lederbergia citrea TaxID=2833581 RepID=A0A942UIN9_9BACI|nr:hypothetical protein [Lederbergia citrea]MBS4177377.1 hypothetical protein [Lederbergia citrea]MBS4204055.1 hypothetical protein [Lederbergia citrea]MBS4221360.1 hypothetical protein [Lederbergia citrea]